MANTKQLAIAICRMVQTSEAPVPIKLANHTVEEAVAIISAVVETCHTERVALSRVFIGRELAFELGLVDGVALPHASRPIIRVDQKLGREVIFERMT